MELKYDLKVVFVKEVGFVKDDEFLCMEVIMEDEEFFVMIVVIEKDDELCWMVVVVEENEVWGIVEDGVMWGVCSIFEDRELEMFCIWLVVFVE